MNPSIFDFLNKAHRLKAQLESLVDQARHQARELCLDRPAAHAHRPDRTDGTSSSNVKGAVRFMRQLSATIPEIAAISAEPLCQFKKKRHK